MLEVCYKGVKEGLYKIDEYGNVYSNYKKGFLSPSEDRDGYYHKGHFQLINTKFGSTGLN